jgi:hypothetical protein
MKVHHRRSLVFICMLLMACTRRPSHVAEPPTQVVQSEDTQAAEIQTIFPAIEEPQRYRRLLMPLIPRATSDQTYFLDEVLGLQTGSHRVEFTGDRFLIYPNDSEVALALTLPGGDELNMLGDVSSVEKVELPQGERIILTGKSGWGVDFQITLFVYPFHPGLIRWRMEIIRDETHPPAEPQPELQFIDRISGLEAKGQLEIYTDRAPMAAPHLYGYSAAINSTIFYWVDLTAINPFMEAARYSPSATPRRIRQQLGHDFSSTDLKNQPEGVTVPIYDSYLYLEPSEPDDEDAMFLRYLHNLGDIYDLMVVPDDPLMDWFGIYEWDGVDVPGGATAIHKATMRDLTQEKNWVTIDGKRYLRAYVGDTRPSVEAITQLDVYSALARYRDRFGVVPAYFSELRAIIPDFFNPDFGPSGMFQNSGPISMTGSQSRGDTWYELGHALKVAELALWDPDDEELRDLALRSGETWIEFAQAVDYNFPRFYTFNTWQGVEREPDADGGYAYFMLLLHEMTGEEMYLDEARTALNALGGYGFFFSYETHMTALTAAAAARMYQLEPNPIYLKVVNQAVANLMRLSWIWECDYGWMGGKDFNDKPRDPLWSAASGRTFFGLNPTQKSAVITPKEQYEAWIYLTETLQRLHGVLDPSVEKLVAEFVKHTLLTIPGSLPPLMPVGAATEHPSAYETVTENDLSLFIPLEDLRDGWDLSGVIGQEIYGAGMAPAMAAQSIIEIAPRVVVYSSYPVIKIEDLTITFAGADGTFSPAVVIGIREVLDSEGRAVFVEDCGIALCFQAEGGGTYILNR